MLKHLNILIVLCSLALAICMGGLLLFFIVGNFPFALIGAVGTILFFALLVVLLKERRVAHILKADEYDKEHEPF